MRTRRGAYGFDAATPGRAGEGSTILPAANRVARVEALRPELCSLDVGSLNFEKLVYMNSDMGSGHPHRTITQGMLLGGSVRVGLEDSIYIELGGLAESRSPWRISRLPSTRCPRNRGRNNILKIDASV